MVQLLWPQWVSAIVHCGSNCTGNNSILYLLPGDLWRCSQPTRLYGSPESLWRAFRLKTQTLLNRELTMESGAKYPAYLVTSDLAPSMSGQCLMDTQNHTQVQAQGCSALDLKGVANPPVQLCMFTLDDYSHL